MTELSRLRKRLSQMRISERKVSINEGPIDDGLSIEQEEAGWKVYYCEKGSISEFRWFSSFDDAEEYLMELIQTDEAFFYTP